MVEKSKASWEQELLVETRSTSFEGLRRPRIRTLALTILCHPDPTRVGEEAVLSPLLSGARVGLSRLEPRFVAPGSSEESRPLAEVHVSRRPMLLLPGLEAGSVILDRASSRTRVSADGREIENHCSFSSEDLERGVALVLGRRVALLLHWLDPAAPDLPDFGLVGASGAMNRLRREIQLVADRDVPVLLRGETGTGKELVAQAIHQASDRREQPYVTLNIGAVPSSLAASELFGATRGAYTGASQKKVGFFEKADGGTLFLDEVGEAPQELQVLLLRALENQEIQPVGSVETRKVDVRVVAATDADLETSMAEGGFRSPLFHRLAGYELEICPLRERRSDLGRLLYHFLREELTKAGNVEVLENSGDPFPSADLVARLVRYEWPGNVRQLRNVARRLVLARQASGSAELDTLLETWLQDASAGGSDPEIPAPPAQNVAPPRSARQPARSYRPPHEVSDEELLEALRQHRFRLKPAAVHLGVSRASLYTLIDRCPTIRRASELSAEEIEACRERHGGDLDAMAEELEVSRYGLQGRMRELSRQG